MIQEVNRTLRNQIASLKRNRRSTKDRSLIKMRGHWRPKQAIKNDYKGMYQV